MTAHNVRIVPLLVAAALVGCDHDPLPGSYERDGSLDGALQDLHPDAAAGPGPGCANGRADGRETDADCGGGDCARCANGKRCLFDSDCASSVCESQICRGNEPFSLRAAVPLPCAPV